MLIDQPRLIGENLMRFRKRAGLTQAELAEKAGLADRTYADIERGVSVMRVSTLLSLCRVLDITPNDILTEQNTSVPTAEEITSRLKDVPPNMRDAACRLIDLFLSCAGQQ